MSVTLMRKWGGEFDRITGENEEGMIAIVLDNTI